MVILNVTYTVISGKREDYISAIKENNIEKCCINEPGCLKYSFHVPISSDDKNTVFLLEKYTDDEAFEFHKRQSHFAKLQEIKAQFVESTDIQIYKI